MYFGVVERQRLARYKCVNPMIFQKVKRTLAGLLLRTPAVDCAYIESKPAVICFAAAPSSAFEHAPTGGHVLMFDAASCSSEISRGYQDISRGYIHASRLSCQTYPCEGVRPLRLTAARSSAGCCQSVLPNTVRLAKVSPL